MEEKKEKKEKVQSVQPRDIAEELRESYLDYAMSIIISRALPDVRDGLKPVQRRILYAMNELGLRSNSKSRKSATVTGEVLGKYHPHSDIAVYDALVRMAQDFSLRYPLVKGQGNFGCFTKDTKVKLCDGRNLSFEKLIKEQKRGKKHWTFSFNHQTKKIEIAEIKKPRLTRKKEEIIKIVLDNNENIKCTLNHRFMLRNGNYKEAKDLMPGDSLMPLYTKLYNDKDKNLKGYEALYQPIKENWEFAHHLADKWNLKYKIYPKSAGRIRHHKDFNKLNNDPDNILRIQWQDHWKYHKEIASIRHNNDPEYVKKIAEGRKKFWSNKENRKAYSQRMTERNLNNWKNKKYRAKMSTTLSEINKKYYKEHPEAIERSSKTASATLKELWKNPTYRKLFHEKIVASNKKRTSNLTGKKKFLRICQYLNDHNLSLTKTDFEKTRKEIFKIKSFTSWDWGIKKYYNNNPKSLLYEIDNNHIKVNHKVTKTRILRTREDVYDLTIDSYHNFSLAAGIFVHNSIDGDPAAAMRYCLIGNTLLLSDEGIIPINKISDEKESNINLKILNYQGNKKTANKFFNSGRHKTISLVTKCGYQLKGTYNHPVLCWNINEFGMPSITWKLLENITTKDFVLINRGSSLFSKRNLFLNKYHPKNKRQKDIELPKEMNKNLGFLLGALVSEGSFHQKQILFCNKDIRFYNKSKNIAKEEFRGIQLYENNLKEDCVQFSIYHQRVVEFLSNIGLKQTTSEKKEIPFSILLSKREVIKSFLVALFEGDGSVVVHTDKRHGGKSIELVYDSKSKKLIGQLKILLLNFGVISTYPYTDKRSNCYRLKITGVENIRRFKKEIGFFSKKKNLRLLIIEGMNNTRMSKIDHIPFLNEYLRKNYKNEFIKKHNFDRYNNLNRYFNRLTGYLQNTDKNLIKWLLKYHFLFDGVKEIKKSNKKENVYSIKVNSKCHSFVANGFINHNTEVKLTPLAEELLEDLDKETVDFVPNYDGTRTEPKYLPAKLPQLILNGTMGIAVGMATNILPHNLREVADALIYLIDRPHASVEDLMNFIKGPDFPTGGIIFGKQNILEAYSNGKGKIICRAKTEIIEDKIKKIIVTEIPYQVNKAELIIHIAHLVEEKKIEGIKDLRDESGKQGMRIVIELKNNVIPKRILNQLFKFTSLEKNFHLNMLSLIENGLQPQVLSVKDILEEYLTHRKDIVKRRTEYLLKKARERAHILEGLSRALDHIDNIIKLIKSSENREDAQKKLISKYRFSEIQANAILEMKLQTLAKLERERIEKELAEKQKLIKGYLLILEDPKRIAGIIKEEIKELRDKYGDERRTETRAYLPEAITEEQLIPSQETLIALSQNGYIKRIDPNVLRGQKRGGKGVIAYDAKNEDDILIHLVSCNTRDEILFFTDRGRLFKLRAFEIAEASRTSRGKTIQNYLNLNPEEKIIVLLNCPPEQTKTSSTYLFMATQRGIIKKSLLKEYSNIRKGGIIALKLIKQDKLIGASLCNKNDQIILVTNKGQSIRFSEKDTRAMGRSASGVIGIKLTNNDNVVSLITIKTKEEETKKQIFVISENGFGKKTNLKEYRKQKRGGHGIKTMKITTKTGNLIKACLVAEEESLIAISQKGQILKASLKGISLLGRSTQGVRIMRLDKEDKIAGITLL